jgi:hypothetical protein
MKLAFLLAVLSFATPVAASGTGGGSAEATSYLPNARMTYALFEASVPHADLATCPAEFDLDRVFCRFALANEQAHVFVFSLGEDQPLLAVKHYELDDDLLPF